MDTRLSGEAEHPLWQAVRQYLEDKRRPVEDEIRRYPPPIAGCDAHFNYLLERRTALSRELIRLEKARDATGARATVRDAVEDFLRASDCIDPEAAARIRAGASGSQPQ